MRIFVTFATIFLTLSVRAADSPTDAENKEIRRFQGTWQKVNTSNKDPDAPPRGPEDAHRALMAMISKRYDGNKEFAIWDGVDEKQFVMTYKLDPTKSPKQLERIVTEDGSTEVHRMIYEIDGDTLRLGFFKGYSSYPKTFDDIGIYTSTWKRATQQNNTAPQINASRYVEKKTWELDCSGYRAHGSVWEKSSSSQLG